MPPIFLIIFQMASQVAALDIGYKPRLDLPSSLKFLYLLGAVRL
jgi:hypothetical protein